MKQLTIVTLRVFSLFMAILLCLPALTTRAQLLYQAAGPLKLKVLGASNIHDWEMSSEKGNCSAMFTLSSSNALTAVSNLMFSMNVEDLKSEHKAMDKNTYKAMNTEKYPVITFTAASATVKPGNGGYTVTARGKLTISGVTREIELVAHCVVAADKSITSTGSYPMKMTEYNVKPPSIMFGAIKTGDAITVQFNFILKPR